MKRLKTKLVIVFLFSLLMAGFLYFNRMTDKDVFAQIEKWVTHKQGNGQTVVFSDMRVVKRE